ncbi:hypothetical protein [Mesobacillus subterraneus]|uniref:Uncharacterized protein n=1 Tax=Mesobacillus subterraneus TaxID=285983 RepID=A0A3R9FE52_9BACI|nr:hypothetical protein [Mesobacillus subterraneus]RSD25932.1 hypothetical protein EJA10_16240 [Mesobacillus subterraneus]
MANSIAGANQAHLTQYIPPKGMYEQFEDEAHYLEKVKEWGLSTKKEFWYKDRYQHCLVTIKGYEVFGETAEYNTLVIEFADGSLTCIHPAYLKEMQSSSFGKEIIAMASDEAGGAEAPVKAKAAEETPKAAAPAAAETKAEKPVKKAKKEKAPKLVLPEEKVHFTATVKQFALSWNHFNEDNDEVIVFENVRIEQDEPIEVGLAWGSHSKTLKKHELEPGQQLEFDGKIVKKSLPKGKDVEDESLLLDVSVGYKINNPSKIVKKS